MGPFTFRFHGVIVSAALSMLVPRATSAQPTDASPSCSAGQVTSPDTAGHCCWPAQAWAESRQACLGIPQCPPGLIANGDTCVKEECPPGEQTSPDTAGHCCWPGQAWSTLRSQCAGIPQCPAGLLAAGELCAAPLPQQAPPPPPSVLPPPPPSLPPPLGRVTPALLIEGGFVGAAGSNPSLHILGANLDAGLSLRVGFQPHFPEKGGGNWHGLDLHALAGISGAGALYADGADLGMIMAEGAFEAGYEIMHFGHADDDFDQHGIGAFIGPRVGFQYSDIVLQHVDGVDPAVGAVASLLFPLLNAKERHLTNRMINFGVWVLPGTGLTFFTIGGGGAI
jgi:hypothetical protein